MKISQKKGDVFEAVVKYAGLPADREINIIQWALKPNRSWEEDCIPSNKPYYFDFSRKDNKEHWNKGNNILHFGDMTSVSTKFMFVVVEVKKNKNFNSTAIVLAAKMWSSEYVSSHVGLPGPIGTQYEHDFLYNILFSSQKVRKKHLGLNPEDILEYQVNITLTSSLYKY